jgi:hypothetical protein
VPALSSTEDYRRAIKRAEAYHLQRMADAGWPSPTWNDIMAVDLRYRDKELMSDGYWYIGWVLDRRLDVRLRIYWNPKTDRVRIDRPAILDR